MSAARYTVRADRGAYEILRDGVVVRTYYVRALAEVYVIAWNAGRHPTAADLAEALRMPLNDREAA